ncbi:GIY-YIG nuclease family protein [Echinicola shivajiensis]|uniref:GIY-YIG nuclease family protein n=1 Tax=Echinicola shivajiensis TaxID=1035916 RepID=UPI001BFC1943|nr:GIY-YIG nuclease family protein [Echinicola shivajiensis]
MAYLYILFSKSADKFYIGHTESSLLERLKKHNSNHKGFTGKHSDWNVIYYEQHTSKKEAYAREREIKSWKSRKRIIQLIEKEPN